MTFGGPCWALRELVNRGLHHCRVIVEVVVDATAAAEADTATAEVKQATLYYRMEWPIPKVSRTGRWV